MHVQYFDGGSVPGVNYINYCEMFISLVFVLTLLCSVNIQQKLIFIVC